MYDFVMALVTIFGLVIGVLAFYEIDNKVVKGIVMTVGVGLSIIACILLLDKYFLEDSNQVLENVIGYDVYEAKSILEESGYKVKIIYEYSSTISEDLVISQSPEPYQATPEGKTVNLCISVGPENVSVDPPDNSVYNPPDDPVYEPPDDPLYDPPDDSVHDTPNDAPEQNYCIVPDLVGLQLEDAKEILHNEMDFFVSRTSYKYEFSDKLYGVVLEQSHRSGDKIYEPVHFTIWVSEGPKYLVFNHIYDGSMMKMYYSAVDNDWVHDEEIAGVPTCEIHFHVTVPSENNDDYIMLSTNNAGIGHFGIEEFNNITWFLTKGSSCRVELLDKDRQLIRCSSYIYISKDETIYVDLAN